MRGLREQPAGTAARRRRRCRRERQARGRDCVSADFLLGVLGRRQWFPQGRGRPGRGSSGATKNGRALESPRVYRRHGAERSRRSVPRVPRARTRAQHHRPHTSSPTIGSGADTASPLESFIPFFGISRTATAPSPPHRPKSRCSSPPSGGRWSSGESTLSGARLGAECGACRALLKPHSQRGLRPGPSQTQRPGRESSNFPLS